MYTSAPSQVELDTKSVVARMDTLRTIRPMENWQDRARSVMREKGITQDALTSVLGVSTRGAVGHYLAGRREPTAKQLRALAKCLEVDLNWLITGEIADQAAQGDVFRLYLAKLKEDLAEDQDLTIGEALAKKEKELEERWGKADFFGKTPGPRVIHAEVKSGVRQLIKDEDLSEEDKKAVQRHMKDELEFFGHMDAWDSNTPLDEDEVELPLFREVELAAGAGQTQVIENHGAKLRFAKSTLSRAGVEQAHAACAFVRGNSMEPVMPDGTCVGVNTGDTTVRDGEIYAIDHDGMLRVKYLHRRPGGGFKIVSQNASEHATEEYSAQQVVDNNIRIIGRVFWWSVLR